MSLNIIKTFFGTHPDLRFGLMSHALVSENFRKLFESFPCQPGDCWLCGNCSSENRGCRSKVASQLMRQNVTKMVDCGIFAKDEQLRYPDLFDRYEAMGADYGVMKDVFGDPKRTVESARRAVDVYRRRPRKFKLVLVAQGDTVDDYLRCSERLCALGVGELAIGGLLVRKQRSARYASAGTMKRMDEILTAIRLRFPNQWMFVLGSYHPKRHALFEKHSVFGSDYKGWIFNYAHRFDQTMQASNDLLTVEGSLGIPKHILKKAAVRRTLGNKAAALRTAYATTKNSSALSSNQKAKYRQELAKVMQKVETIDRELVDLRGNLVLRNGLPQAYKAAFDHYKSTVLNDDQAVRIAEVHRYLREEIVPKMWQTGQ